METLPINKRPIGFFKWFEERDDEGVIEKLPPHDGDVSFFSGSLAASLDVAIRSWLAENDNAQYLVVLAHGIWGGQESEWVGIGSAGEPEFHLTWPQFWDAVYSAGHQSLAVYLIGCSCYGAAEELNARLTTSHRAPHLVALNTQVTPQSGYKSAIRIMKKLISAIQLMPIIPPDEILDQVLAEHAEAEACWPALNRHGTHLICVRRFRELTGLDLKQYVAHPSDFPLTESQPWRSSAQLESP